MARLDPAEGFEALKNRVKEAVAGSFPQEGARNVLKLESIDIPDKLSVSNVGDQKAAKMNGRTWGVPVHATLVLEDKKTGKVLDRSKIKVATLPKITNRYSYIVDGSEYQIDNQWRLKPGVYTKVQQNGELDSFFNIQGQPLHVGFDPKERSFVMKHGGAQPPLYPIMRALGHSDADLEQAWGKDILNANMLDARGKPLKVDRHAIAFAKRLVPEEDITSLDQAAKIIQDKFAESKLHPDVTSRTLGKPIDRITPDAVLRSSQRLLGVARGTEKPDVRDSLMFKEFLGAEDFVAERIKQSAPVIQRRIGNNIDRRDKIRDIVGMDVFQRPVREFFSKVSLASTPEQTNPLKMISGQLRTTISGEGGVKDANRITEDAKLVDPSHFGILDPLHTPESSKTGVNLQLSLGARKVGTSVEIPLVNAKTGKIQYLNAGQINDAIVALPDSVKRVGGKFAPKEGSTVLASGVGNELTHVPMKDVQFVVPRSSQMFSIATNMVPFISSDSPNRATMAGRHMEQAIPVRDPEPPLVQSVLGKKSFDELVGSYASHSSPIDGTVLRVEKDAIHIKGSDKKTHVVHTYDHYPTNDKKGMIHSTSLVKAGDKISKGQVVADTNFTKGGIYAPGKNLQVAYMPWRGYNFEDGVVLSETAAQKLTSEHLFKKGLSTREVQLASPKKYQAYYQNRLNKEQAAKLDGDGVIKPGMKVNPGDTLIAALVEQQLTTEEQKLGLLHKSLPKPFKDKALTWDEDVSGEVIEVNKRGSRVDVHVKTAEPMDVGDKLVGRHGNKGICYLPDTITLCGRGWVPIAEVTEDDLVCTLNQKTNEIEYQKPTKIIQQYHSGQMYLYEGRRLNLCTTPDHQLYVRTRRGEFHLEAAQSCFGKPRLHLRAGTWVGVDQESVEVGSRTFDTDVFLHFFGFWIADGCTHSTRSGYISLCQRKSVNPETYQEMLDSVMALDLGCHIGQYKDAITFKDDDLYHWLLQFGHAREKFIPRWILDLSRRQLQILMEQLFKTDRMIYHDKRYNYTRCELYTSSKMLADDYQELALKVGCSANILNPKKDAPEEHVVRWTFKNEVWTNNDKRFDNESWIEYDGPVHCVEVPNHVIYIRRNGIPVWCGNCTMILPDHEMPKTKDGKPIEVIMNPIGTPGRMNIGQVLETAAAKIAQKTGQPFKITNFELENNLEHVENELKKHGLTDKETIVDPKTGKEIPGIQVGPQYILKMEHQVGKKMAARSRDSYDRNLVPKGGGPHGAQALGSLGIYSMLAHGAKCLMGGTTLRTKDGRRVEISDVVKNRRTVEILCADPETKELDYKPVVAWSVRVAEPGELCCVSVAASNPSGRKHLYKLKCTENHTIYTDRGEIQAGDLEEGDYLLTPGTRLHPLQRQMILGSVLGDGSLSRSDTFASSYRVTHGEAQREYCDWKREICSGITRAGKLSVVMKGRGDYSDGPKFRFWTKSVGELSELRQVFYPEGKKIIPQEVLDELDEVGLAFWFMDDGNTDIQKDRPQKYRTVRLAVCDFDDESVKRAQDWFESRWGLYSTIQRKSGKYLYLHLFNENATQFLKIVSPYIHETMRYKLCLDADNHGFSNADLRSVGSLCSSMLVQAVEGLEKVAVLSVDPYEPKYHEDYLVYNVEVEDHHNYVADGVLVGNSNIREMQTYKSDRAQGGDNDELWSALQTGEMLPPPRTSFAYEKFNSYLKAMGVNTEKDGNSLNLVPLTDKHVLEMSNGELKDAGRVVKMRTLQPEKGGLFDPKITGGHNGSNWAHISLSSPMPNPLFEKAIMSVAGIRGPQFDKIVNGTAGVTKDGVIVEQPGVKGATYGPSAVRSLLAKVDVSKELKAEEARIGSLKGQLQNESRRKVKYLRALDKLGMKPTDAYMMNHVPVLPPNMRPIAVLDDGSLQTDDLNEIYKQLAIVINKHGEFPSGTPQSLKAPLQADIYDHLKALTGLGGTLNRKHPGILDTLSGRDGPKTSFVQDVLIKRKQDLTMRSTIVPEPALGLDEAEIPRKAAKEMYKPFTVRELRRVTGVSPLAAKKMIDEDHILASQALDRVVQERPVLLKRDPVLHKYGIQAFKPRLVDGKAIKIHPLVCSGYNADFDGDTMSAYVPITAEAVKEAEQMFPSRNLFSSASGSVMYTPGHEAQVGLFMMVEPGKRTTHKFKNQAELEKAVNANTVHSTDVVQVGNVKTTLGRLQINSQLPQQLQGGKLLTDLSYRFTKKEQEKLFNSMAKTNASGYPKTINTLKDFGNEAATMGSFSFGLGDFKVHHDIRDPVLRSADAKAAKLDLTKKEHLNRFIDIYEGAMNEIDTKLKQRLEDPKHQTNLVKLEVAAGIKGKGMRQLTVAPILFVDGKGEVVPSAVKRSFSEGLSSGDYWAATSGGRKGAIQKVQSVSKPGYLTKQMANSTLNMLVAEHDCGTSRGVSLHIDEPDVIGRYTVADLKLHKDTIPVGTLITPEIISRIKNAKIDKVVVRSPMRCVHGKGVCAKSMHPGTVVTVCHSNNPQRPGGDVQQLSFVELFDQVSSPVEENDGVQIKACLGWFIWDDGKWTTLKRVLRHPRELEKKILEIRTSTGHVQHVTEDHTSVIYRPLISCPVCRSQHLTNTKEENGKARLTCLSCHKSFSIDSSLWSDLVLRLHVRADMVLPGDRIRNFEPPAISGVTPPVDPYFLGCYLSEGHIRSGDQYPRSISIAQADNSICKDRMVEACNRVGNSGAKVHKDQILVHDSDQVRELGDLFDGFHLAHEKRLPGNWMGWDGEYKAAVVAGLVDGDGSVRDGEVNLASTSYTLLIQAQTYLRSIGVRSSVHTASSSNKPSHGVATRRESFVLRFPTCRQLGVVPSVKIGTVDLKVEGRWDPKSEVGVVLSVKEVSDRIDTEWVYDVTTSSSTFTANGAQTHNCMGISENGKLNDLGTNVGILATQSIGERGTQLAMKAFHSGGVFEGREAATKSISAGGLERAVSILNLPQKVKGSAILSTTTGRVNKIEKDPAGGVQVSIGDKQHYVPVDRVMLGKVRVGAQVKKGDQITSGPVNPHELLPLTNMSKVQGHLAGELHSIYGQYGIKRRHSELMVRALSNVTKVENPGSHPDLLPGDFTSTSQVYEWNKENQKTKPVIHTPVLRGVKTIPLDIQEDWMARLNHEHLKSTLVEAAQQGWQSNLHGMHPIPPLIHGADFGRGTKEKPWAY